jgi:cell division protein FtsI (penicillin-binding protein 3)
MTLAVVGLIAVVGLFAGRLVDIQVVQAEELQKAAEGKRSITSVVYGTRGDIVDTSGVALASSVERYDIIASPKNSLLSTKWKVKGVWHTSDRPAVLQQIADATGATVDDMTAALDKNPSSDFAYLAKGMTLDVRNAVLDIVSSQHAGGWVFTQSHPARTYPLGAVAGNIVGFIGTDGPQAGLELAENSCIASSNGTQTSERGEDGVRLPGSTVTTKAAKNGGTLELTIDSDFQWFVQQTLAEAVDSPQVQAQWGTAVVVRVKDGAVMAMADYPSVDPNNVNGVGTESLGAKSLTELYEPGSTFKAMTAAMLINEGKITQTTPISAPPVLKVGGGYIKDVFSHPTMNWTTTGVLVNSSNIGISILSEKLSKSKREAYMRKFGIGSRTAITFPGQGSGQLSDSAKWDPITTKAVAFGQGVSATSAQVAGIFQTLGNDGTRMPLKLIKGCRQADGTLTDVPSETGIPVVSKDAARKTVQMLENVVTQGGLSSVLTVPGYNIAAKTGTAQVAKASGGYGADRVVSVAGLVSGDNPQYAVVVTLGKPKINRTSAAAAPAFHTIVSQVIKTFRVKPSTTPVPDLPATW